MINQKETNHRKLKIALILNENSGIRSLSTFPSVCNTALLLNKFGYHVDLFLPDTIHIDYDLNGINLKAFKIVHIPICDIFAALISNKIKQYELLIAFHIDEFIVAGLLGTLHKIPVVYFCLEILDFDQVRTIKSKIKKMLEIYFNKKAALTITQDESRKNLICKINHLPLNKVLCIPNSYIGIKNRKTDYLRRKFKIDSGKIIILYTGGIESWAIDENLINASKNWDSQYVLVLHGWSRDGFLKKIQPLISEINRNNQKIFVSEGPLCPDDYNELIMSSDIALVWLKKNPSSNVKNIGLSSGKMSSYLRCGIPIVVPAYINDLESLANNSNIGVAVNDESEINIGISKIANNYETYRTNALKYYSAFLDFEKYFIEFRCYINNILDNPL